MLRPRNHRLLVFQVPFRQKLDCGLYAPRATYKAFSRAEDIWIIAAANDCDQGPWVKGMHGVVSDAFELDPTDFDLWEQLKDDPAFVGLKEFAAGCEGEIQTKLVHEDSVLALYDL